MHRIQSVLTAAVLAASMVFGTAPVQADTLLTTVPGVVVSRISGSNRYATAYAIATKAFPEKTVSEAVLVSGANFPDALAASGYAGMKKCPVLITAPDTLSSQTQKFIQTKKIKKITIIGGTSAVSSAVENKLVSTCGISKTSITRVKGSNRRETAEEVEKAGGFDKTGACVITSGRTPADALSISPWCYKNKWPIFLTDGDGNLSAAALDAAKSYAHVYILGSTTSVSDATASALPNSERIEGKNRYETSVKIASKFAAGYNNTLVASGQNTKFADALSGAMLAGLTNVPIILADSKSDAGTTLMKGKAASISRIYVLGSANSVSDLVAGTMMGKMYGGVTKLTKNIENKVDLNNTAQPDTIKYTTKNGSDWLLGYTLYVNGTTSTITLPEYCCDLTVYAVDVNIADNTKNIFVEVSGEDNVNILYLYAFNGTSLKMVKSWGLTTTNNVNDYSEGDLLTAWMDGSGVFKFVTGANVGIKVGNEYHYLCYLDKEFLSDSTIVRQTKTVGYFKDPGNQLFPNGFVQPFIFNTIASINLYSDAACTKISGSIPANQAARILSYRTEDKTYAHNLYVYAANGAKGWIKYRDFNINKIKNWIGYA